MAALFGSGSTRQGKKNLLEIKAGKMYLKGKMCHPDKRKGLIYIHQTEDSLMHFCWKERGTGKQPDDDLLIFPDDVEFKRVPQCTTGRVYVLKFKSSNQQSRKFIFWLQEPKTDKDDENCQKVNDLLNNPPTPGSTRAGGSSSTGGGLAGLQPSDLANLGEADLSNILSGMNQQQLLQLIGGIGGLGGASLPLGQRGTTRPASNQSQESGTPLRVQSAPEAQSADVPATPPQARPVTAAALPGGNSDTPTGRIQISDLQSALLSNAPGEGATPVNLSEALNSEKMIPILADVSVRERLTPFLPQDACIPSTEEELRETMTSPQFKQALAGFSSALATGELGPVLAQFGLSASAVEAAKNGDVEGFAKALQDDEKKDDLMEQD